MLTLADLKEMDDKYIIRVNIYFFEKSASGDSEEPALEGPKVRINQLQGKALIPDDERRIELEDITLFVDIERGAVVENEWKRIKEQIKECGFTHIRGQPTWFNIVIKGKWRISPCDSDSDPLAI